MAKYVISGYIGFDNFGDEAIASVLSDYLKSAGAEKITYLSLNPQKTASQYGVNSAPMLSFIKPIIEADILISGGGSLLQDVTSLKSLIYYLAVIMTALAFGKKVYIFAQGFSKFRTKIGEFLTKFVLKRCDRISVRDSKSQEYLKSLGIESELVSDPVYNIKTPSVNHSGAGVQLRGFRTLTNEFMVNLADEIARIFPKQEIKLISLQDTIDLPVINKFAEMISANGCIPKIIKNLNVMECIHEISSLEYFIGMRFHACLIASKSGVKTLGINYDDKVKNLAKSTGFPVINMFGCEVKNGIAELMEQKPEEYKIPAFEFPNIIP